MAYAWEVCQKKNPARLVWGETGPRLMAKAVKRFGLERYKRTHQTFCPIDYEEWRKVLQPGSDVLCDERTYGIHLWNEMWRLAGQDKDAEYHATCLYEKLKRNYLPVPLMAHTETLAQPTQFEQLLISCESGGLTEYVPGPLPLSSSSFSLPSCLLPSLPSAYCLLPPRLLFNELCAWVGVSA